MTTYIQCECGNENDPTMESECGYCGEPVGPANKVYVAKKFNKDHQHIISRANVFIEEYRKQGYKLSLRQLYYRFIAKAWLPNTEQSYKRLGSIITDARLAGEIPFDRIEDRGRKCKLPYNNDEPASVLDGIEYAYSEDRWATQDTYVEVWVEKDALSNVIERPCNTWDVPYMACKGYMSASAQWDAGNRFKAAEAEGKRTVLIHLGDHDPSGIDMTRDNQVRVSMFSECEVEIRRIAMNMDQIEKYSPPPNPTKVTDSRAKAYMREFGDTSWELDALTPSVISDLISSEIKSFIDFEAWNAAGEIERENREMLAKISDNAQAVLDFVSENF